MPSIRPAAPLALVIILSLAGAVTARAGDQGDHNPCTQDAMIVFDASGSMAGNVDQGIATI
ncbi:MAG: hypothetical protein WAU90_05800, partial [Methyloceanibacter sp.]